MLCICVVIFIYYDIVNSLNCFYLFFFFQAEDGIRDIGVTGVQTCALPISARVADGHRRVDAAVVELDALADAVGPRAEDDHARAVAALDLVLGPALPARVEVGRARLELRGAGVDSLERALAGERGLGLHGERAQLAEEPRIDAGAGADLV